MHIGVKGFETPYILGWVDLPERIRLITQIDYDPKRPPTFAPDKSSNW